MAIRDASRVRGSLWDVTVLSGLPSDDCNILLCSSRTLYLLANLAQNEVNWTARYYKNSFGGGLVETVEAGDTEAELVDEFARLFRLEVIPVNCDILPVLEQMAAAQEDISSKLSTIDATLQGINATLSSIGEAALSPTHFDDIEETINEVAKILGAVGVILT